jgi:hypothetical protein
LSLSYGEYGHVQGTPLLTPYVHTNVSALSGDILKISFPKYFQYSRPNAFNASESFKMKFFKKVFGFSNTKKSHEIKLCKTVDFLTLVFILSKGIALPKALCEKRVVLMELLFFRPFLNECKAANFPQLRNIINVIIFSPLFPQLWFNIQTV